METKADELTFEQENDILEESLEQERGEMDERELREKIYKIIDRKVYSKGKTSYPTKKDLKRNPHMHPGFEHVVYGKRAAARRIVGLLNQLGINLNK